jgi:glucokinase
MPGRAERTVKWYVGVDVGGTKMLAVLAACEGDTDVRIVDRARKPTMGDGPAEGVLRRVEASIDGLLSRNRLGLSDLSGIGIAVPGPVDSSAGKVVDCVNLPELAGVNLRQVLAGRYRVPVGIANDAHAAALAEARKGAGRGYSHFIYLCLGTGIGCGIVIDGELYRGADGAAGEVSHIVFPGVGELFEVASGKALKDNFGLDAEDLRARVEASDPKAIHAFHLLVRYLGAGIANLVTLFNPGAIVFGGGLSKLGDFLLGPIEQDVRRTAFSISGRNVVFLPAGCSLEAEAIGTVFVCMDWIRGQGRVCGRRNMSSR